MQPPTVDWESSEPRVWLPGEGWVVVQPDQGMQEAGYAADSEDAAAQQSDAGAAALTAPEREAADEVRCLLPGCPGWLLCGSCRVLFHWLCVVSQALTCS